MSVPEPRGDEEFKSRREKKGTGTGAYGMEVNRERLVSKEL